MQNNGSSSLPHGANALLSRLWAWVDENPRQISRDHLRTVAWQVSLRAREAHLLPEELILAIRENWNERDEASLIGEPEQSRWVLTEVIALCIEAFYRGQSANGLGANGLGANGHAGNIRVAEGDGGSRR